MKKPEHVATASVKVAVDFDSLADSFQAIADAIRAVKPAEDAEESNTSNLVEHARTELEMIGEDPETIEGYLKVIQAFADMGHSGGSASVAIPVVNELLQFHNLKPLTDGPDEWNNVSEQSGYEMWQNRRNGEAFSHDGGTTYWLLSEGAHSGNREPMHISATS